MEVVSCLRMNGSDHGERSYANNSILQRTVISKTRPMVEQTIKAMDSEQCFAMADLGCSSGPNTLLFLSNVIDVIESLSEQGGQSQSTLELQVFLNDLPTNDFNSVFMSLPYLYQGLSNEKANGSVSCYVSGTPGSFYGRLFPDSSLHFVHSSYSLHWLSQVPRGIKNNKGNIYIASTSPPNVFEAYKEQFRTDFSNFLNHRVKELKPRGRMLLAFIGRSDDDPTFNRDFRLLWDLLSKSLLDMVEEGTTEEDVVDSFNLPNYFPTKGEVKEMVEGEGCFRIDEISSFEINWDGTDKEENENDGFDNKRSGQKVANIIRAAYESWLVSHFGEGVIEDLFSKYAKYIGDHLSMEKPKCFNIVLSMTKK